MTRKTIKIKQATTFFLRLPGEDKKPSLAGEGGDRQARRCQYSLAKYAVTANVTHFITRLTNSLLPSSPSSHSALHDALPVYTRRQLVKKEKRSRQSLLMLYTIRIPFSLSLLKVHPFIFSWWNRSTARPGRWEILYDSDILQALHCVHMVKSMNAKRVSLPCLPYCSHCSVLCVMGCLNIQQKISR